MRIIFTLYIVLGLGACTLVSQTPKKPSQQDKACAILKQRGDWSDILRQTEKKWGVSAHILMAIIWKESSFRGDARPPRKKILGFIPGFRASSAFGYAQAIDGTWAWYKKSQAQDSASRTDFADSADFIGWYINMSEKKNKIPKDDVYNQYLAYHQGHAGYARGSYKKKPSLIRVAKDVKIRADLYQKQLKTCHLF